MESSQPPQAPPPPPPPVAAPAAVAGGALAQGAPPNPPYPARLDVVYPGELNRFLPLVKGLLLIPHYIVLIFVGIGALFAIIGAWFSVLFTGKYPRGVFDFLVGTFRWSSRVNAYALLQTDQYPPFSLDDDPNYPVRVEVDYQENIARWRALLHGIMAYPALLVGGLIGFVAYVCVIGAFFSILFTKRYPPALFNVVTIAFRWSLRVSVFANFMTEKYPPFVWA